MKLDSLLIIPFGLTSYYFIDYKKKGRMLIFEIDRLIHGSTHTVEMVMLVATYLLTILP